MLDRWGCPGGRQLTFRRSLVVIHPTPVATAPTLPAEVDGHRQRFLPPSGEVAGVAGLVLVEHERGGRGHLVAFGDHPGPASVLAVAEADGHGRIDLKVAHPVGAFAAAREEVE